MTDSENDTVVIFNEKKRVKFTSFFQVALSLKFQKDTCHFRIF